RAGFYECAGAGDSLSVCNAGPWTTDFVFSGSVRLGGSEKAGLVYDFADGKNFSSVTVDAAGSAQLAETIGGVRKLLAAGSYPGAGENAWVEVEIVRTGTDTTVRVNGARIVAHAAELSRAPGRIGLSAAAGPARFAHVSVTCTPVVVYRQTFDGGRVPGWFAIKDAWVAGDGVYACRAGSGESLSHCDGGQWATGYTYGLSLCLPASGPAASAGAVYNYTDGKNYCAVLLTPGGTAEMRRVADGVSTVQAKGSFDRGDAGRWIDLTILRTGTATTVNVDGRRVFTAIEQGDAAAGEIGLMAAGGAAKFDDVVVTDGLDPYKKTFPKIGGIFIGGPRDFDQSAIQAALAKHDFVILGMYPGFERGGKKPAELLREIRARNPALVIGNYTNVMETYDKPMAGPNPAYSDFIAKLSGEKGPAGAPAGSPNDWWARNSEGALVGEGAYPRTRMTNTTYFVQPDADGMRYPQWYAQNSLRAEHFSTAGFDFMFSDNTYADPTMFSTTPGRPDRDRDGHDDSGPASAREFRLGLATYVMKFRQLEPGMFEMGNVGGQRHSHPLATPELQDLLGAALYEGMMGAGWSEETWSGWSVAMDNYRSLAANVSFPGLILAAAHGTADGRAMDEKVRAQFPSGYAFMRYALTSALLGDAYFSYSDNGYSIERCKWFDEFDLKLGHAVDPPSATPFENGVYRRRFQNGMVLVNPRTNPDRTPRTAETVTIEPGYRRFRGRQDPVTNNGEPVSKLTLAAGDGIILVRI
ncbi:MAG TPA: putative glycoside hydrolase, partial [Opitutus sp.]|nr:putative glycoside hydrolase [Opitutus sp.]